MFLLEDGNGAGNYKPLDKPRKADGLIAVLSSAAIIFYIILSLLSVHHADADSLRGSQAGQPAPASVGSVISTTR